MKQKKLASEVKTFEAEILLRYKLLSDAQKRDFRIQCLRSNVYSGSLCINEYANKINFYLYTGYANIPIEWEKTVALSSL